jgi:hypothetical protein
MDTNTIIKKIESFEAFSSGQSGLMKHGAANVKQRIEFETSNTTRWIEFNCSGCGNVIKTGIFIGGYKDDQYKAFYCNLSWMYRFNKEDIDYWANMMGFEVKQAKQETRFYAYINSPYRSMIHILLKQCSHCNKEYLVFFAADGKTMWDPQDIITIHGILEVKLSDEFKEDHFFKEPLQ